MRSVDGPVGEPGGRTLGVARQRAVITYLKAHETAGVTELAHTLRVSASTVRRDLDQLERAGEVSRVHGGAMLLAEPPRPLRAGINVAEKRAIGYAASCHVKDGDTILITGGTTTQAMLPFIVERSNLAVLTNSLGVAMYLADYPQVSVVVLGGYLRHDERSLLGHLVERALEEFTVVRTFTGVFGIDAELGLTGADLAEAQTDRVCAFSSPSLFVLADSSKFSRRGGVRLAPIERISMLITTPQAPFEALEAIRARGVEVELAGNEDGLDDLSTRGK